jgi:hypothetical protein
MKDYVFCAHAAAKTISLYPGTLMKEDHRPIPPDLKQEEDYPLNWELIDTIMTILALGTIMALGFVLGRVTA